MEQLKPDMGRQLKATLLYVEDIMEKKQENRPQFYNYDRLALAEAVMERVPDGSLRTSTYLRFTQEYGGSKLKGDTTPLKNARDFVLALPELKEIVEDLKNGLESLAYLVSNQTMIPPGMQVDQKNIDRLKQIVKIKPKENQASNSPGDTARNQMQAADNQRTQ
jgi:hypothetical protein